MWDGTETAAYLLEVGRFINKWHIGKADAQKVGWTKLQIIARHVSRANFTAEEVADHIKLAPSTRTYALREALCDGVAVSRRTAMFRLTENAKDELSEALLAFGAEHWRAGLAKKEEALLLIVRAAMHSKAPSQNSKGLSAKRERSSL